MSHYAICPSGGPSSGQIYFTGFDFSALPGSALIDGVEVLWDGLAFVGINEISVRLLSGGEPAGSNEAGMEWEAFWKEFVHAWDTHHWGLSLTPSHITSPRFGFALNLESAAVSGAPAVALVRNPRIRVYYH